jgi:hypothetical protein
LPKKKDADGAKSTSSTQDRMKRNRRGVGTGALCAEAQADGVPCFELGRECATCERAKETREDS